MNVIIPVAGIGKRLRPLTYSTPKALLPVAGKTILAHILEKLKNIKLNKFIFIIGVMGEKIKEYINENYAFNSIFIEQKEQLGLGHAVWLTKEIVGSESCIIIYGDTIFGGEILLDKEVDGCIGVKEVDDPRRFGVCEIENGFIKKFVEKPEFPTSNLAIVGVNFIKNSSLLYDALDNIIREQKQTRGEFQLTDAFELMIKMGAKFRYFSIEKWYDCGTKEAVLSANCELLKEYADHPSTEENKIISPVFIHKLAKIEHSTIGPNVSIDKGVYIKDSKISNSIINYDTKIENSHIEYSIIGANAVVEKVSGTLNIGDFAEVKGSF